MARNLLKDEPEAIVLTDEQKEFIAKNFAQIDVVGMAQRIFGAHITDSRKREVRVIKEYIAQSSMSFAQEKQGEDVKLAKAREANNAINPSEKLSDEELSFIVKNASAMRPIESARILFGEDVKTTSYKYKSVLVAYAAVGEEVDSNDVYAEEKEFSPPKSLHHLVGWANEFIPTGDPEKKAYNYASLKPTEEVNLRTLLSYMKTNRFCFQASHYNKKKDRDLYIGTFMRYTHDKSDLTAEEVDQYVQAAAEVVNIAQMERNIQQMDLHIEGWLTGDDEERKKMSMSMVELVHTSRSKLDASKERLKKLIESLIGSRSERIKNRASRAASIVPLLDAWINEERRIELIALAQKEHDDDKKEYNRIKGLDDVVALVAGMTEEEAEKGL